MPHHFSYIIDTWCCHRITSSHASYDLHETLTTATHSPSYSFPCNHSKYVCTTTVAIPFDSTQHQAIQPDLYHPTLNHIQYTAHYPRPYHFNFHHDITKRHMSHIHTTPSLAALSPAYKTINRTILRYFSSYHPTSHYTSLNSTIQHHGSQIRATSTLTKSHTTLNHTPHAILPFTPHHLTFPITKLLLTTLYNPPCDTVIRNTTQGRIILYLPS